MKPQNRKQKKNWEGRFREAKLDGKEARKVVNVGKTF